MLRNVMTMFTQIMLTLAIIICFTLNYANSTRERNEIESSVIRKTRRKTVVNEERTDDQSLTNTFVQQPLFDFSRDFTFENQQVPFTSKDTASSSNNALNQLSYGPWDFNWEDNLNLDYLDEGSSHSEQYNQPGVSNWNPEQVISDTDCSKNVAPVEEFGNSVRVYSPDENQNQSDVQLEEFVNSVLNFDLCERNENFEKNQDVNSPDKQVQNKEPHKIIIAPNKKRKNCFECYKKQKQEFAQDNILKYKLETVNTKCEQCGTFLCQDCFDNLHGPDKIPRVRKFTKDHCPLCNEKFGKKLEIMLDHTKFCSKIERPKHPADASYTYVCFLCPKIHYAGRTKMKFHLQTHLGQQPYYCADCDRRFSQKFSFTRHMNNQHQRDPNIQE